MRRVACSPETLFALAIVASGATVVFVGAGYSMGAMSEPGPGVFPVALGTLLVVLGIAIALSGPEMPEPLTTLPWRPLVCVGGGIMAWALLIDRLGFVPATIALVSLSGVAERRVRPVAIVAAALVLSLGGTAVFIHGFGMPFAAFRW